MLSGAGTETLNIFLNSKRKYWHRNILKSCISTEKTFTEIKNTDIKDDIETLKKN